MEEKLYASGRFVPSDLQVEDGRYISADELYAFISDFMSKTLEQCGFKYQKSKKTFSRKKKSGVDEISIRAIARLHFDLDFTFKKRVDEIQKIITAFDFENKYNSISNFKEHSTIWVCYSNLFGTHLKAITLATLEQDLQKLMHFIENEILPYFDKLDAPEFLNNTFNYPEKDPNNPFSYFAREKNFNLIIPALIIAKKLNDPNYPTLVNNYLQEHQENEYLPERLGKLSEYQLD